MKYNHKNEEWMGSSNKAIAIIRVSSHRQKDNSPQVQKSEILSYCEEYDLELVREFDMIESAKDHAGRDKYQAAIKWAIHNNIRHVVFYMTDREGRNFTDIESSVKLIKQDIIVVHYARDNKFLWANSSPSDFTFRQFQALYDKQLSDTISVKVNDAMTKKAESGWFPNNHAPLGYVHKHLEDEFGKPLKRGTIIVPDPEKKKVQQVIREFELCAQGYSIAAIRKQIIEEGFVVPSGVKGYSKHGIEGRIKSSFYRGYFKWKNKEYKGKHELIIPKSILDAVEGRFGNKRIRRKATEEKGIFSGGWIRCGHPECGLQIVCEYAKKTIKETGERKEFKYYRCSNSRGIHESLKGMYKSEEELMAAFEPALDKISITKERAAEIAAVLNETDRIAKEAISAEMSEYRRALDGLHKRRMNFLNLLADGGISKMDCQAAIEQIEADQKHFTKLLEDAQYKISDAWKLTAETVLELAKEAKELWKKGSMTERLEILKRVCWNPILDGVNLRYGLRKPFATIAEMSENQNWRSQGDLNPKEPLKEKIESVNCLKL